ncbi:YaaL family protein [Companilactobacillus jidongensis]|uniref:YaaL family protein n=1 Tax=Companilactobacillus jidongensis TaxID=2486006 RepID=UPI000F77146A|nr:YaaL family protein [Companilactobacillus jidongensis]
MFGRKKASVEKIENDRLMDSIHDIQRQISNAQHLMNNSLEISDEARLNLRIDRAKYQFLYLEARRRKAQAKHTTDIIFGDEDTFLKQPSRAEKHW